MASTASATGPGAKKYAATGAATDAASDAAEDILATAATASHTRQAITPTGHASISTTPSPVATPLPPLKASQTGNICPITAPRPAHSSAPGGPRIRKIPTATAPFAASSSNVAAASPLRPVRSTLVAPIPPEPIARMSPSPASRVSSTPNGTEPNK